ncbi:hypothetical protein L1887_38752 [Cichorium endivia]|nr:hypothetical protein L1887_38752 [Cichorium endivia]
MKDTTSLLSEDDDDSSDGSWIFTDNASSSNSDISYSDSICSISSRRSYSDVLADRPPYGPGTSCEQDLLEAVDIKGKSPLHEPDSWEIARIARASRKWKDAKSFSKQESVCRENARQEDERASEDIFDSSSLIWGAVVRYGEREGVGEELEIESRNQIIILNLRNKGFENSMTIDLHGQHVKEGVKILKHHLVFGVYRRSLRQLRVITGYGSHGTGPSELKQSFVREEIVSRVL